MSSRQPVPDIMGNILAANAAMFSQENIRAPGVGARGGSTTTRTRRASYDDVAGLAESIRALADELPETLGLQQPPVARSCAWSAATWFRSAATPTPTARRCAGSCRILTTASNCTLGTGASVRGKLLAAENGAYEEIPVLLAYADDLGMWRHVVAENSQRKDINAIEEAESLQLAINRFGLTQEEAGSPSGTPTAARWPTSCAC